MLFNSCTSVLPENFDVREYKELNNIFFMYIIIIIKCYSIHVPAFCYQKISINKLN